MPHGRLKASLIARCSFLFRSRLFWAIPCFASLSMGRAEASTSVHDGCRFLKLLSVFVRVIYRARNLLNHSLYLSLSAS